MTAPRFSLLCSAATLALLTACAGNPPTRNDGLAVAPVESRYGAEYGRVTQIETVSIEKRSSAGGAILGAVIGGLIGSQVGGGTGNAAATGVGVVGGAIVGNQIEKRNKADHEVYRVSVRYDNGRTAQFDYERIDNLRIGDRVKVEDGQVQRL